MNDPINILGAGGHAKVLISTLRASGREINAVYDDAPELHGTSILDIPVRGKISDLPADFDQPAVIGIGDNQIRREIATRFPKCKWVVAVHPGAVVAPTAVLEPGTVVFAGAVIQTQAKIGRHTIVNTGATIDHECRIGAFSHIGPGANLAGQVTLNEGVFAGIGCCTIQNVTIGAWTTIGAGAVVINDLPPRVTAVGVPARIIVKRA